jgi:hypothetical protein
MLMQVLRCSDHGVLDARHDGSHIDEDDTDVDHNPELQDEEVLVPSPATPIQGTTGSPRMPVASAITDASSESEPLSECTRMSPRGG